MAVIELEKVQAHYNEKKVLNEINLSIEPGEVVAILGPSGSGKSSLLNLIIGQFFPSEGNISIFGQTLKKESLSMIQKKMGYAMQQNGLFPHLTLAENISLPGKINAWKKTDAIEKTETLLATVGLPLSFKDKYVHQLSGGEAQRGSLCRALFLDPPILLFDEPFSALDPSTRADMHSLFKKLQNQKKRTAILVTHDVQEAIKLSDTIFFLNQGEIVQFGTPMDFIQRPANALVESFFHKQLPQNILRSK